MYDFKKIEEETARYWKEKKIYDKVKAKKSNGEKFFFMDGPPYATGHIHMGTALNKVLKDIVIRSKRMQGLDVVDTPGYDTHGMPIEYKVEKEIGVKSKKDIEKYGVKKFVDKCKEFATRYIGVMNDEFDNLGVWMDWKHPYITLEKKFIETNWWTFKNAYDKGLLYLGKYPVHICPRCETAVAYNEIEYAKQEDRSIYVKFPIKGERNKFLVIWTTTPWTLPGNTGVMANPNFEYAEVQVGNEKWILAKELVKKVMDISKNEYKISKTFKGQELEGIEYENPLVKNIKVGNLKNAYKVILSQRYVNLDEGTGLVHTAPGHGKEDYEASRKYNLDILSPVKINGELTKEAGKYAGKKARIVDEEIIDDLDKDGFLVANVKYLHDYPQCWRCQSSLLMISIPQWFLKISEIHDRLMEENEKINWTPDWAKLRMKAWLEGISDWPISRDRYWGTPLPIWICEKCDEKVVIGSVQELEKLSKKKIEEVHKPEIDKIEIKCKCGGVMKRTPEVLDVWFDSGVASWAELDYPRRKDLFEKYWPANLNLEGPDQFRGWWNSELILSIIAFDKRPYNDIYVHGLILDLNKNKMSKSRGDATSPQEVIDKFGRDALRFYFSQMNPGANIKYDETYFRDINKFFIILFNIKNLIENEYGLKFAEKVLSNNIEDKWIISKLENLKKEVVDNYNRYLFYKNSDAISKFLIEDVSRSYIQIIRDRISENDKKAGEILNYILSSILLMIAPIIPFITDDIYRKMKNSKESIHLDNFMKVNEGNINKSVEDNFTKISLIIEKCLAERDKIQVGLKWPLAKITIHSPEKLNKDYENIILNQLNIKKIEWKNGKEISVILDKEITPELEAEGYAREISRTIQSFRKKLGLNKKDMVKTYIIIDEKFKKILDSQKKLIKERTNSKELEMITTDKEKFKNKIGFEIKDKRGDIAIVPK